MKGNKKLSVKTSTKKVVAKTTKKTAKRNKKEKKLPKFLHREKEKGSNVEKEFGKKQATNSLDRGVSSVKAVLNKK